MLALVQILVLGGESGMGLLSGTDQSLVREQITAYWAVPAGRSLLGAWEQISAVLFQIGAIIVCIQGCSAPSAGLGSGCRCGTHSAG